MGRLKKYHTEEERKEARRLASAKYCEKNREKRAKYRKDNKEANRLAQAKWYANNKEKAKERKDKWKSNNKEKYKESNAKYNAGRRTHFVVYTHTNSNNQTYIGCGHNLRPYDFSSRGESWKEAFKDDYEVTILAKYKNRVDALELERHLIKEIGLDNLINVRA